MYEVKSKKMNVTYVQVPSQDNGYDCGVYLLQFFEDFMKHSETFLDKSVFYYTYLLESRLFFRQISYWTKTGRLTDSYYPKRTCL